MGDRTPSKIVTEAEAASGASGHAAGIVIITRNRFEDLKTVFARLQLDAYLKGLPVLVYDDASDSAPEDYWHFLEASCVKVLRATDRYGYIYARNEANRQAPFDLIFSLDDDSCLIDAGGARNAVRYLENNPSVAVLSFPVIETHQMSHAPAMPAGPCASFIGCGHLIRREVFLKLGGYRVDFVHQVEELELAMRIYQAGYEIRHFPECPVEHWSSDASRDWRRMGYYGPRNQVFMHFLHTPAVLLPFELLRLLCKYGKLSFRTGLPGCHFRGWIDGIGTGIKNRRERKAMGFRKYLEFRNLQRRSPQ
ncbi:MAG: glycosyltransferase [Methylacidiphilales bacterium]|nr:glycosyltransferase [Candidatus Methylacidiphilales bacterium]